MKHLSRISILFLAVLVVTLCLVLSSTKANAATEGYYTYTVSNGEATITDVDTAISGDITIPTTLGGYPVTSIGEYAFYDCTKLTGVTIGDSVTSIGYYAFNSCTKLTSISIPDSVIYIDAGAFSGCTRLTSVTIPTGITSIGDYTFSSCTRLTGVTMPNSITSIGNYAFSSCSGLTSMTLPGSVTTLGRSAFSGCENLTNITLPYTITSIDLYAFLSCNSLTDVYYVGTAEQWANISIASYNEKLINAERHYIDPCASGHSYGTDHKCTVCGSIGGTCGENLVWTLDDAGLMTISGTGAMTNYDDDEEEYAPWYSYRSSIVNVVIREGVTTVGRDAFRNCESLLTVTTPQTMQTFGYRSFSGCTSLKNITIPATQSTIAPYTFSGCDSLTEVTIPSSVSSIQFAAFSGAGLVRLVIPDSVSSISENAFKSCYELEEVIIGKGLTFLGPQAFAHLKSGPTVTFLGNPPQYCTYDAFSTPSDWFDRVIAYYPAGNSAWNDTALRSIYSDAIWKSYCPGHDWAEATCIAPATCVLCGQTSGNALGHSWVEATCTAPKSCTACGSEEGEALTHSGTNEQCELCNQMTDNYWLIPSDATINVSLTQDIYVDLNGYDLSGTIILNGHKVYGMDSATNEYTYDTMGHFTCVDESGNAIVPESLYTTEDMLRYMTIGTDDGYTFHRFYLGITNISLSPLVTGFGYKAEFYGDEMVQSKIVSVGYSLWLGEGKPVSRTTDFKNVVTLRLQNFDVVNYGEIPVKATATITLADGTTIESATASYSMRQMVELVNEQYSDLNETQLSALQTMLVAHPAMKSWQVENIYKES